VRSGSKGAVAQLDDIGYEADTRRMWELVWVPVGASSGTGELKVPKDPGLGSADVGGISSAEDSSEGSEKEWGCDERLFGVGAERERLNMCVRGTAGRPVVDA
jgi:hypothetical protein